MAKQSTPKKNAQKRASKTVALTGATGFLGGHVIETLLSEGYKVRALTRRNQEDKAGITWVKGDLNAIDALEELCTGAEVVIHMAGATKALSRNDFFDANAKGTRHVLTAASKANVAHFIHISSLAAREPQLSHYAASKAASEVIVRSNTWPFSHTIIRPPAIYGPGDMEILKMLKATKLGFLPVPVSHQNRFSMIHGADMADIIKNMVKSPLKGDAFEVDDLKSGGYRMKDIAEVFKNIDGKSPKLIVIPKLLIYIVGALNGLIAALFRRPAIFTFPKAREIAHPNWAAREGRKPPLKNWSPKYKLEDGLKNTIEWYRQNQLM